MAYAIDPTEHLGLVCSVVAKFADRKTPLQDTEEYSDGILGLLSACEKFEKDKNVEFSTYAHGCILNAVLQGWRSRNKFKKINSFPIENDDIVAPVEKPNLNTFIAKLFDGETESERGRLMLRIIEEHFLNDKSYAEIGRELGFTRAYIQQLSDQGLAYLKQKFGLGDLVISEFAEIWA